jgi:hypothetical protein
MSNDHLCHVALLEWSRGDGIAEAIHFELKRLGYHCQPFQVGSPLPHDVDVVFSFAPYGDFMVVPSQLKKMPVHQRPILIHWNTEGLPDLNLPWTLMSVAGKARSWVGRLKYSDNLWAKRLANTRSIRWIDSRLARFRYLGDYLNTYQAGILHVFADSSAIYARLHEKHGLPTIYAPWGATPLWYADLNLGRDIDVLWMGKRATKRRSNLLDMVRDGLERKGATVYVADNEENPFVFGEKRIEMLNRAKITLNLTRTWYDDNFSRFSMAASNRSLVVSEPLLAHCPECQPGKHYISVATNQLVNTILYYLANESERHHIVENAYRLVTTRLTFANSIKTIMNKVDEIVSRRKGLLCLDPS